MAPAHQHLLTYHSKLRTAIKGNQMQGQPEKTHDNKTKATYVSYPAL